MWPGFGYSPITLLAAWLRGGRITIDWPQFQDKIVIPTYLSRISIALAFEYLKLSPGDEVLAPSYNCGSEVDPLLWCGAKVVFYRVDSHAQIDIEDIQNRLTSKTRAVYITHYFGWPQRLAELALWCKERDLLLIEDCALSLFSAGPEGPLGCVGDAAIHGFRKALPVPDGGALCLPMKYAEVAKITKFPDSSDILSTTRPFLTNWLINNRMNFLISFYKTINKSSNKMANETPKQISSQIESSNREMPSQYYFDERMKDWNISRISKGLLHHTEIDQIVQIRRRNYTQLYEAVKDLPGLNPLFDDLPEGVCPLVFPVLVSDPIEWQRAMTAWNIYPYRWWAHYHPALSWDGFPEAIKLKSSMLTFSVHQYINEDQITRVASIIKAFSLRSKA